MPGVFKVDAFLLRACGVTAILGAGEDRVQGQ
jgi:hypothetical protein